MYTTHNAHTTHDLIITGVTLQLWPYCSVSQSQLLLQHNTRRVRVVVMPPVTDRFLTRLCVSGHTAVRGTCIRTHVERSMMMNKYNHQRSAINNQQHHRTVSSTATATLFLLAEDRTRYIYVLVYGLQIM